MKTKKKKRNPTDLTLTNLRALKKRVQRLEKFAECFWKDAFTKQCSHQIQREDDLKLSLLEKKP